MRDVLPQRDGDGDERGVDEVTAGEAERKRRRAPCGTHARLARVALLDRTTTLPAGRSRRGDAARAGGSATRDAGVGASPEVGDDERRGGHRRGVSSGDKELAIEEFWQRTREATRWATHHGYDSLGFTSEVPLPRRALLVLSLLRRLPPLHVPVVHPRDAHLRDRHVILDERQVRLVRRQVSRAVFVISLEQILGVVQRVL